MIRAFLFDLDGVLTDTSEYHFQAWRRLAGELGLNFTREDNEALRGVSRRASLDLLLKGRPVTEEQAAEYMQRKNRYYQEHLAEMTPADVLPGALAMLRATRAAGIRSAIVSVSRNAPQVVDALGLRPLIDALIDGSSGAPSKPAPDLFLLAAERLGVPPAECLVFEDAAAGVEASHRAGMRTVGLGPAERIGAADLVLPDLAGQTPAAILAHFGEALP